MSQPIRGQGGHLVFPIGLKNTNLVEDVEILLPIEFRWILFSGFRGKVENVSANQRPGRPSCFSDRPEKHKLIRGRWDLASCQVLLNSVHRFQKRSRIYEKLTTDDGRTDGRTDDGRLITIVHLAFGSGALKMHIFWATWQVRVIFQKQNLNTIDFFTPSSRGYLGVIRFYNEKKSIYFYAPPPPLNKEGILHCTCPSVCRLVCRSPLTLCNS